jgi:hypothetical protein
MPNTGERREITRRVNAKEAETVQQSKKLVSRTRQVSASTAAKNKARLAETKRPSAGCPKLSKDPVVRPICRVRRSIDHDHGSRPLPVVGGSSDRITDSACFHTSASHSIWVWAFTKARSYQGYLSQR